MLASPALAADCPTVADMPQGVLFSIVGGDTDSYRSVAPGVVESIYTATDGFVVRSMLGQGTYLLELVDLLDGSPAMDTRTTYGFSMKPTEMPVPVPNGRWSAEVVILEAGELRNEIQSYSFGAKTVVTMGACSYDMIPIEIRYGPDNQTLLDVLHYLPALELAYFAASSYDGTEDVYDYYKIERLR
ncbi:hypothetical protein VK792_06945 [Mesobacterium sp. TK19101]|uniref:Uncharacterized protein n=1 Tax=Mesobacterium hydrothermale TaxID=3111907 RepID=A0ABU6HEW8_9RHOB|nr:hypothetical protein [Mesobacterium sp. TK19101]MEC3861017.1 hypothetical protein [Mesobacterium sp. TK19101]